MSDLYSRIAIRFKAPEYAVAYEVRNCTGYARHAIRYADALAFSLFPSRGLTITGLEVKVARSDWIKERDNPAKAESIGKYCHYWYMVAPDITVVPPDELPTTWGLLIPNGKSPGLKTVKRAEDNLHRKDIDLPLMCSILRNFTDRYTLTASIGSEIERKVKERVASELHWKARDKAAAELALQKLQGHIQEFQNATGLQIGVGQWRAEDRWKKLAALMRLYDRHGDQMLAQLRSVAETAENIAKRVREELSGIDDRAIDLTKEVDAAAGEKQG